MVVKGEKERRDTSRVLATKKSALNSHATRANERVTAGTEAKTRKESTFLLGSWPNCLSMGKYRPRFEENEVKPKRLSEESYLASCTGGIYTNVRCRRWCDYVGNAGMRDWCSRSVSA